MGAMSGYARVVHDAAIPWLGVLAAAGAGARCWALLHGLLCSLPRVNDIAVGIALMLFGTGLRVLPRQAVRPAQGADAAVDSARRRGATRRRSQAALQVNPLFLIGLALAIALAWAFRNTRWGLVVRMVGESSDAARAMGYGVSAVRTLATAAGGMLRRRSAARSCRSTTRAAGTRGCRAARA